MTKELQNFRIKTWHFVGLFFLFVLITDFIGEISLKKDFPVAETYLKEISAESLADSISSGTRYILFYNENSSCAYRMEANLAEMARQSDNGKFYKVDIEKNPTLCEDYNVRVIPSVIVYRNGMEADRILGLVPLSNIKLINRKIGGI